MWLLLCRRTAIVALLTGAVGGPDALAQPTEGSGLGDESAEAAPVAEQSPAPRILMMQRAARPALHGADAPHREPRGLRWDNWGHARVRSTTTTRFPMDDAEAGNPTGTRYESRVVHGLNYAPSNRTNLVLEVDVLNGQFAGERSSVGTSIGEDTFRERRNENWSLGIALPRKAYLSILANRALIQLGQQTFTWGTGYLANDGAGDPDFGDARQGSLVERVLVATSPWARTEGASPWLRGLSFLAAADVIFRDDNASLIDGDFAFGGVLGARIERENVSLGVFESFRKQRDRVDPNSAEAGERTIVRTYATNLYGRGRVWESGPHGLTLEGEATYIAGFTDRPYLDETFEDGAKVRAFGGLFRVRYDHDDANFTARLELGAASGDNDPRDDVARGFSFNSDYNVGLILFEQILPMVTARSVDRVNDRGLLAETPGGLRYTVNQGTVTNALYLYPVVRWRPNDMVDLRFAYLMARSAADFADVYQTGLSAGYNTTPGGVSPGSRFLGHELDLGARFNFNMARLDGNNDEPVGPGVTERLGVEGGVFFPGAAFSGLNMDPVYTVRGHFDVIW